MSGHPAAEVLARCRTQLDAVLDQVVPSGASVALVDFPWHSNVGDTAIWRGERHLLQGRGSRVVYASDSYHFDPRLAQRRLGGDGIVLINGGGNFGDLYQRHQRLREQVLTSMTDHAVVQLPQTVNFSSPAALDAFVDGPGAHPRFTALVRDEKSMGLLEGRFAQPVRLVPDAVLGLAPQQRRGTADRDVQFLLRDDGENAGVREQALARGLPTEDWLDESKDARSGLADWTSVLSRELARRVPAAPTGALEVKGLDARADREWVRGTSLLSRGRVVVTDRLHGHVVSFVLGIPHVVLNDRHGKVFGVSNLWIGEHPLVRRADTLDEAMAAADELLAAGPPA